MKKAFEIWQQNDLDADDLLPKKKSKQAIEKFVRDDMMLEGSDLKTVVTKLKKEIDEYPDGLDPREFVRILQKA